MGDMRDRGQSHERARPSAPVFICLMLGGAGLLVALATGGLLGWILAGFLGPGAYFHARPPG